MRSLITIVSLLLCTCSKAQFVHSIQDGNWYDPMTWDSGTVPGRADSIWVFHVLETDSNVKIDSGGYLMVDSLGALCIGDSLLFSCQTYLYNEGYVAVRYIHVHDGWSTNWITFGRLRATPCDDSTRFHMEGGQTGHVPCSNFIPSDSTPPPVMATAYPAITVSLLPNPATDHVWVHIKQSSQPRGEERYCFVLYDMVGKELVKLWSLVVGNNWVALPDNLAVGSYLWHVFPQMSISHKQSGAGVLMVGE